MIRQVPTTHYIEVYKGDEWVRCHPINLCVGDIVRVKTLDGHVVTSEENKEGLMEVLELPAVNNNIMELTLGKLNYSS
jgi:hypothetical protein